MKCYTIGSKTVKKESPTRILSGRVRNLSRVFKGRKAESAEEGLARLDLVPLIYSVDDIWSLLSSTCTHGVSRCQFALPLMGWASYFEHRGERWAIQKSSLILARTWSGNRFARNHQDHVTYLPRLRQIPSTRMYLKVCRC
jgi:hypothetical protein